MKTAIVTRWQDGTGRLDNGHQLHESNLQGTGLTELQPGQVVGFETSGTGEVSRCWPVHPVTHEPLAGGPLLAELRPQFFDE